MTMSSTTGNLAKALQAAGLGFIAGLSANKFYK